MWSRTSATTRSSSSSRITYPHSQITWLAIGCPPADDCRVQVLSLSWQVDCRNVTNVRDMVRIQLCGRFAVVVDGQPAESRLPGRQGRLLVAYLAAYRAQPVERTVLLDVLWPDGGAGAAGALTVLLSKARALLAPAEIRCQRTRQWTSKRPQLPCTQPNPQWRCGTGAAPGQPRSPPSTSHAGASWRNTRRSGLTSGADSWT